LYTRQELIPGQPVCLQGGAAHYLMRVLRAAPGQSVVLFNGDGHDYVAEVSPGGKNEVKLLVLDKLAVLSESPLHITLVQALARGERMDLSLQKATELGAAAFQPLLSERVEVRLRPEKVNKRLEHWRGVIVSACEQCGRARLPELGPPLTLSEYLARESEGTRVVLAPAASLALVAVAIRQRVTLLVGPEGGFTEAELGLMETAGIAAAHLGPRVLRTESAGPAAIAVLQSMAGDLA
jgi:16S rRNA (uracil1498-N3)-methyltransferase